MICMSAGIFVCKTLKISYMKRNLWRAAALVIICCAAVACRSGKEAGPVAGHVVFIGLDGWGSYSLPQADMPNVKALMENGCHTLEKRTVLPSSSAPNWASMFMGAGPELHGFTTWGSQSPDMPSRVVGANGIFPTVFTLCRESFPGSETGVLYEWDGIKYVVDTLSLSMHAHLPASADSPDALCSAAEKYLIDKKPMLAAICFDEPDHAGHAFGHDTPEYYAKLHELDGYIGRIVKAVEEAGIADDTIFIVTSDHGGIGYGHGGISMEEMETPLIVCGKGVRKGCRIEESVMQYDVASTIAYILGMNSQPQVWLGRPLTSLFCI